MNSLVMSRHHKTSVSRPFDLATFIRRATVVRALRYEKDFRKGHSGRYMLVAPEGENPVTYVNAVSSVLADVQPELLGRYDVDVDAITIKKAGRWLDSLHAHLAEQERYVLIVDEVSDIPLTAMLGFDRVIALQPPTLDHWRAGVKLCLGLQATDDEIERLSKLPLDIVTLATGKRGSVGEVVAEVEAAMNEAREGPASAPKKQKKVGPRSMTLDQLPGYGDAKHWGLDLSVDLQDWKAGSLPWSDVDRGALLFGPPGTGKSTFAAALATTCKAHLVATSVAQWQSAGHLGDFLKAMRTSFAEARGKAPSILFIDELDSIGDRARLSGDSAHYCREACNGLLEAIDGLDEREGVVIVGACNDPRGIDAALLRSGRLDLQIEIPLPDEEARRAIVAIHQPESLTDQDRAEIAALTDGFSGADLEGLCRRARRRARKERRPVTIADFRAELPDTFDIPGDLLRMIAIHEAGHALLAAIFDRHILHVEICETYREGQRNGGGHLEIKNEPLRRRTRDFYRDEITMMLGGIAAESLLLGDHGDGGGGCLGSDIQMATDLATAMEASLGLGQSLVFHDATTPTALDRLRRGNPPLAERVHRVLEECFDRATHLIAERRGALEVIARTLIDQGRMDGDAVKSVVTPEPQAQLHRPFMVSG